MNLTNQIHHQSSKFWNCSSTYFIQTTVWSGSQQYYETLISTHVVVFNEFCITGIVLFCDTKLYFFQFKCPVHCPWGIRSTALHHRNAEKYGYNIMYSTCSHWCGPWLPGSLLRCQYACELRSQSIFKAWFPIGCVFIVFIVRERGDTSDHAQWLQHCLGIHHAERVTYPCSSWHNIHHTERSTTSHIHVLVDMTWFLSQQWRATSHDLCTVSNCSF